MTLHTGRRPAYALTDPDHRRVTLTRSITPWADASYTPAPVLTPPAPPSWGMDGNDGAGDCVIANGDHKLKAMRARAKNAALNSTTAECLAIYSKLTGYDPTDPNTDRGTVMQDFYTAWRKDGITLGGVVQKVALFASVDHTDRTLFQWCVEQFGAVGLGIAFPNSAMDQFNAGEPWTVVKGEPEPQDGHAIPLVGWDADWAYVVTWGRLQRVSWAFLAKYMDEAWVVLDDDFVSTATGRTDLGGTLFDLGAQFQAVTGQPNPFPDPVNPPPVPPTPTPAPPPFLARWLRSAITFLRRLLGIK